MTVRKSLEREEEYRVRDTDGPVTEAGRRLLDRLAPERDPWRCPLPDSGGEHVTYGGLCHCGWSRNQPEQPGRAREPDLVELTAALVAIEAEVASRFVVAMEDKMPAACAECSHPRVHHGYRDTTGRWVIERGCWVGTCPCKGWKP